MEKDILKNANFGDRFITRDGRKAIFVIAVYPIGYHCAVEEEDELIVYYSNGSHEGTRKSNIDIVGKEPIDKEQLKERAERKALGYNNSDVDKQDYYLGYCDGAVDQRRLDIDKACELVAEIVEDLMARNCEIWSKESKRKTLENVRNAMGDITTIEERARDYACHVSIDELKNEGLDAESFCGILHGYIRGAHEQKKLDIKKACEWLKTTDCLDSAVIKNYLDEFKREFRKAMEE